MFSNPAWTVDVTRVLTRCTLATVLADARKQAERSLNAQRNLVIVRLACCCGLSVSEVGALCLDDVNVEGARPHIRPRRETTKGKKARCVPLWRDAGTLMDLAGLQQSEFSQNVSQSLSPNVIGLANHCISSVCEA
jgi:integrase